jgi:hypothetical protein
MDKFEYKIHVNYKNTSTEENERILNELGEQGWELVSFLPETGTAYECAFLKRKTPDPSRCKCGHSIHTHYMNLAESDEDYLSCSEGCSCRKFDPKQ